jgi:hypothetical protein
MKITIDELKELIVEAFNELMEKKKLKGKQKNLDVAPPFGELNKYDFQKLRAINKSKTSKKKPKKED